MGKKRQFEMGCMPTMTKLGPKKVTDVRSRGGNQKHRALRIDHGCFAWGSESVSRKCRVIDVVYNATNNELVRTKTLVKNAIVKIDATPFRQWYLKHYDVELNKKKLEEADKARAASKKSKHVAGRLVARGKDRVIDQKMADQFNSNQLYACISSRPDSLAVLTATSLKAESLTSTPRSSRERRSDPLTSFSIGALCTLV